eukprot:TRINITY_DN11561_c1_g1_i3.p6 TRINITY_DN11561_c1_g1~~TRINITY_DN11561_c1_g1_i3.p6  ORF type:complete len:121 (+),score=1.82 TRINITY_DN11561_c1_g1_i3:93-455(+)
MIHSYSESKQLFQKRQFQKRDVLLQENLELMSFQGIFSFATKIISLFTVLQKERQNQFLQGSITRTFIGKINANVLFCLFTQLKNQYQYFNDATQVENTFYILYTYALVGRTIENQEITI